MLQETITRIKSKISAKNIIIVTNAGYKKEIQSQVRGFKIPTANILLEPSGKNTAPAICWAASLIHHQNPDAIMAVFPSDHLILNKQNFLKNLNRAFQLAEKGNLVTFGIVPTRPETGYGYIQTKKDKRFLKVRKFTEKPTLAKAKSFLKAKTYLWNSGMFIWQTEVILEEFKKYLPKVFKPLSVYYKQSSVKRIWSKLPNISVDYGILEKTKKGAAVRADNIGWSDLGSWESLMEILSKDKRNNIFRGRGDIVELKNRNTLVWSHKNRLIATVGLENTVVIDTQDGVLVCRNDLSQDVKLIVDILKSFKEFEKYK